MVLIVQNNKKLLALAKLWLYDYQLKTEHTH